MSSRLYWFKERFLPILDIRFVPSGGYELIIDYYSSAPEFRGCLLLLLLLLLL